ncbi:MAG: DUF5050 domain-containing protein [Oscillospiraceae bacterium]|nr:DUF5050 domain-containing protein [Oscillospiraceae bacterium]
MENNYREIFEADVPIGSDRDFIQKIIGKSQHARQKQNIRPIYALSAALIAITVLSAGVFAILNGNIELTPRNLGVVETVDPNEHGNLAGNINNGGYAAYKDGWIYYVNSEDNYYLYKTNDDNTVNERLNSVPSKYINVVGNWVYYTVSWEMTPHYTPEPGIYKTRTDGTEQTRLSNDGANFVTVVGEWIYYVGDDENCKRMYKMRTDGKKQQLIAETEGLFIMNINVSDGWIYWAEAFSSDGFNDPIKHYKMRTDGTEKTQIVIDEVHFTIVDDDWIYYTKFGKEGLYKIRTDGTEQTLVANISASYITIDGDWIYFSRWGDKMNGQLYKIRTDGTELTLLVDTEMSVGANVAGDWVYYRNRIDLNKIRID